MYWSILFLATLLGRALCIPSMPIAYDGISAGLEIRQTSPVLATWLWDSTIITNTTLVAQLITFARANGVTRIYAQIDQDIQNSVWQSFISQCGVSGITVDALLGNAAWILGSGTPSLQSELQWIQQFQGSASVTSKFTGIHMDIEPWTLDGWTANQASYIQDWENTVQQIVTFGKSLGMEVAAALPFWAYTLDSTTAGQTMDIWLLEVLDSATFMTYRNTAAGVEALASAVLAAGDATGKPVWLAVETTRQDETPTISYYGQSKSTLQSDLNAIAAAVGNYPSFAGIGVHDYNGWVALS